MRKFVTVFLAVMVAVAGMVIAASAKDPYYSPTGTTITDKPSYTIVPEGPTGPTSPHSTTKPGGGTTSGGGTTIPTTATPGETVSLSTSPYDIDDATGGQSGTGTGTGTGVDGSESGTAKPDKSPDSPETGSAEKYIAAAVLFALSAAVAAVSSKKRPDEAQ